jgi:two-component system cell cycle response regulator DivK
VDDNPGVREALQDRLESMGHTFESVGSQDEALKRIAERSYDYILLDLELPSRFGRTPMIPTGKNLLTQILASPLNRNTPVLIVTAHGHDNPDLCRDVMKLGAKDFIKKPFPDLEQAVTEALSRRLPSVERRRAEPIADEPLKAFSGGELVVTAETVELCGVGLCDSSSGRIWQIVNLLSTRTEKGTLPAFSGKELADRLRVTRGEKGIAEAVKNFRERATHLLAEQAHLACEGNDVIATTTRGYQLSPKLNVQVAAKSKSPQVKTPEFYGAAERKEWFLSQLRKGKRLTRRDYEQQFEISTSTAKRDLADLSDDIEFVGIGEEGYYKSSFLQHPKHGRS